MFNAKRFSKIISLILCFTLFFSLGNVIFATEQSGDVGTENGSDVGVFDVIYKKVVSAITDLLISFGDGVVHLVTVSVGETVTIDKLVYGEIKKVNIDYWNDSNISNVQTAQSSVKAFMEPVVEKWYSVFFKITLMVYMVVLVYLGVLILFTSTAEKKANYKDRLLSWVIGLTILFMFPYVMKYTVLLNNAFVKTIQAQAIEKNYVETATYSNLVEKDFFEVNEFYGEDEFLNIMTGVPIDEEVTKDKITDMMLLTRYSALNDGKQGEANISLAIVYLILIGQMIAILIMYYKRAFMIAFLITIFPLVAMTYVIDKIGDGKTQSFSIWFKEFVVNVIVQMFHAVVYVLVTGAGIKTYIENDGRNFVFMILCVLFLFEGEKILRSIFNIKSGAKSMDDLAASGALIYAMAKNTGGLFKRDDGSIGSAEDKKDIKDAADRNKKRTNKAKEDNKRAVEAAEASGQSSYGEYQGDDLEPEGVSTPEFDADAAQDTLLAKAMKRRLKAGLATRAVNTVAGAAGATAMMAKDLSDGKTSVGSAIGNIAAGKSIGKAMAKPITMATNKLEQIHTGNKLAAEIMSGSMDSTLGIDKVGVGDIADTMNEDYEKNLTSKQEAVRKALAEYSKTASRSGKLKGEIKYYNSFSDTKKK